MLDQKTHGQRLISNNELADACLSFFASTEIEKLREEINAGGIDMAKLQFKNDSGRMHELPLKVKVMALDAEMKDLEQLNCQINTLMETK